MRSWVILAAFAATIPRVAGQGYVITPGVISALRGGSANLSFLPAFPSKRIFWCYWKYSTCGSPGNCPTEPFIGYNKLDNRRENISRRHGGWMFENSASPCQGGIWRSETESRHQGWYQMIYDDHDRTEYESDFFPLDVYEENDLAIRISINDDVSNISLSDGKYEPIKLTGIKGVSEVKYVISLFAAQGMPRDVRYKMSKSVKGDGKITINDCRTSGTGTCEAEISLGQENDVIVTARVDSGIQGYPDIEIEQAFDYVGINTSWNSAGLGLAGILAGIVCILLVALPLAWFVLIPRYKRHTRKTVDEEVGILKHDLETRNGKLEKENREKDEELSEERNRTKALVEETKLMKQNLENIRSEKQELERQLGENKERILSLELDYQNKEKARQSIAEEWSKKDDECKKLEGDLKSVQANVDDLRRTNESLETDLKVARSQNKNRGAKMSSTAGKKLPDKAGDMKTSDIVSSNRLEESGSAHGSAALADQKGRTPVFVERPQSCTLNHKATGERITARVRSSTKLTVKLMQEEHKQGKVEQCEVSSEGLATKVTQEGENYIWTLTIKEFKDKYAHAYYLLVKNKHGTERSDFSITTEGEFTRPTITQPLLNTTIYSGKLMELSVKATGKGQLAATWFKNDCPLEPKAYLKCSVESDGAFTLRNSHPVRGDAGRYKCMIVDEQGLAVETEAQVDFGGSQMGTSM